VTRLAPAADPKSASLHPAHLDLARRLREAYGRGPIPPPREALPAGDADGAYAIQAFNTRHWVAEGRRIVGRKIGLTAKAVQAQLGVDQPDFGVLFADMRVADGGRIPAGALLQPRVEAEVALVMARDVTDPKASREEVEAATAHAAAAIEIVDSRIVDWRISFADTVADNGSAAFFVIGEAARPLAGLDLWTCGMALEINGEVASLGAGAACLGHPLNAATWLARLLAARGEPLRAGDVVLTGALGPMAPLKVGDVVRATIGGLGGCGFTYGDDR
jgi:2-keto-4-pentenoate hydratase